MTTVFNFNCCKCGTSGDMDITGSEDFAEYLSRTFLCPSCESLRLQEIESRKQEVKQQEYNKTFQGRFERSLLPEELLDYDSSLGNNELLKFIQVNGHRSLFIAGKNRIGKTRASVHAAHNILKNSNKEIRYCRTTETFRKMSIDYGDDIKKADRKINELSSVSLVIFEDMGKESLTDRGAEIMYEIIDTRLIRRLPIWVTTNKGGSALIKSIGLDRGRAIVTRLEEMSIQWPAKKDGE